MRLLIGRYAKPIHGCHISPSCSLSISFSSNKRSLHLLLRQVKIPRKSVRIAAKQGRVLIRIMLVSEPSHLHVMESWSKEFHRFITKGHAAHHWPSACPRIGLLAILWRPSKQILSRPARLDVISPYPCIRIAISINFITRASAHDRG